MRREQRQRIARAKARTAAPKPRTFGQKWADMLTTARLIKAKVLNRNGQTTLPDLLPNGLPNPVAMSMHFGRPPEAIVPARAASTRRTSRTRSTRPNP